MMNMDYKEIMGLIEIGEGYDLEFKEKLNGSIGKEICAFANSSGGKIILGVKDNGEIKGVKISNNKKSQIQDLARNMDPSFQVSIERIGNLVIINVPEGDKKPYSIKGYFYLRIGANSQKLKRDEIRDFFRSEGLVLFDEQLNKKFNLESDFDKYKFRNFLKLANITDNQEKKTILNNLGLLDNNYLANAGVLLFCHRITKFFLQAKVICVLFEGTSRSNIIDKKEFDADLISNYENAYNFIISKLNTKYIIEEKRTEKLELPKEAIRESLMNALIHRDYFSTGHVQINIFIDRVEINNPGGLVKGLLPRDFGKRSLSRNPLLFDLLSKTDYVEKAGTGINRIISSMGQYGLGFEFKYRNLESFTTVLQRERIREKPAKNQPKTSQKPAKEKRKKEIVQAIKEKRFTKRSFSEKLGVNKSTIESDLEELKIEKKIKFIGPKKGGHWVVLE